MTKLVEFRIHINLLAENEPTRRSFEQAFKFHVAQTISDFNNAGRYSMKKEDQYLSVKSRLDQFAEFVILRNQYGGPNWFKDLDPSIVEETPRPRVHRIDVTGAK